MAAAAAAAAAAPPRLGPGLRGDRLQGGVEVRLAMEAALALVGDVVRVGSFRGGHLCERNAWSWGGEACNVCCFWQHADKKSPKAFIHLVAG